MEKNTFGLLVLLLASLSVQASDKLSTNTTNETKTQSHSESAGKTVADSLSLDEVVVTGTRNAISPSQLTNTITIVGREKLTEQYQPFILPTLMQQVPGLTVTSRGMMGYGVSGGSAGGLNMRGIAGNSGQLLVLIDGHPQYQGIYGHPICDSYQTMMAERVEVLRGPASVLYGSNAMGGVINIITRNFQPGRDSTATDITLGAGSYGTVQGQMSNQTRKGKFSSTLSVEYNRSDNHRSRMGYEQFGGYAKVGYDINNHWKTFADVNITRFTASYPDSIQRPRYDANQWIMRGSASAVVDNHYERTSGSISVYSNFGNHRIDDGWVAGGTPQTRYFRSHDALTGISWNQSATLFKGNRLTLGMDYQHIYGRAYYTDKITGDELNAGKQAGKSHRNEIAAYIDFRQDIVHWLTVDAGARIDHHSVTGTEFVPQAGIVVHPIATGDLKVLVCKGFRNPTMRELYLYQVANEDLKPERLWNYEISWHHRIGPVTYGANLFYIKGDNMILPTALPTGGKQNLNTGKVENCGFEVEANWHIDSHWSLSTNHSYLRMLEREIPAAPKYKGFLGGNFHSGRWSALLGIQYVRGLGLDANGDGTAEQTEKDFCLVNASASFRACRFLTVWVRGENLLAQRYQLMYGYPMPHATAMAGVNIRF